jgi:RHS repeat-associated protein
VRYYGYRYYNPGLGRWISRDPIGELGFELLVDDQLILLIFIHSTGEESLNIFSFVDNSPRNHIDPYGLQEQQCCITDSDEDGTPDKDDPDFDPCSKVNIGSMGAVVCFHGTKYGCVWPENWNSKPIHPGVVACAQKHEDVHVNDPNIKCDDTRCDVYPPTRDPEDEYDQECPAYKAAYKCLLNSGLSPSVGGWKEAYKLAKKWKDECQKAGKW